MTFHRELKWHILWSPTGFGNTTAKLVELWEAIKLDDPSGDTDVFFPTYIDRAAREREVMVPLFPNYTFVKCRWHSGLEDRLREMSGIHAEFLRPVGVDIPYEVTPDELVDVRKALDSQVEMIAEGWHVGDFVVGDNVVVKNLNISGRILYFLPPNRAMIETIMFNQKTPVPVKVTDIERV